MEHGSTWAAQVPLATLVTVIFAAGILYNRVANLKAAFMEFKAEVEKDFTALKDSGEKDIAVLRAEIDKDLNELKKDFKESAKDQGTRIGELYAEIKALKRADDVRTELTGRHRAIPVEVK